MGQQNQKQQKPNEENADINSNEEEWLWSKWNKNTSHIVAVFHWSWNVKYSNF
jgi:hypothetical protein